MSRTHAVTNTAYLQALTLGLALLASASQGATPCAAPAYRAFDFWLGQWTVTTPDGKVAGANRIDSEYDGCVLHERYTAGKYRGESLNTYDPGRGVWHQTWVDNQGTLLLLEGGLVNDAMILEGQTKNADGQVVGHRITWTPGADGSVRQLWQMTNTEGAWETAFDGRYTRQ